MATLVRRIMLVSVGVAGALAVASASAASSTADIRVNVVAGAVGPQAVNLPSGGSLTVPKRAFVIGIGVENNGPDPADVRVRIELPPGLHWGTDLPDPSERCTATPSSGECSPATLGPSGTTHIIGWLWNVTADAPGSYLVKVSTVSSSTPDPDPSSDSAAATVVVRPLVAVTAARLHPTRPRAGSIVVASVGVSGDVASRVACSAAVGTRRVPAQPRASDGRVTCTIRTPQSGRGKLLHGKITFAVAGTGVVRNFTVRLR